MDNNEINFPICGKDKMKDTGMRLYNKKSGEECKVYQAEKRGRWENPGDYLLEHQKKGNFRVFVTWSFLCDSSFFTRVIDFLDWELKCNYCGTWYTFEYFKNLSQLCDLCVKHGRIG